MDTVLFMNDETRLDNVFIWKKEFKLVLLFCQNRI